jgi:DNA-binding transcriptional ArsR family regulator
LGVVLNRAAAVLVSLPSITTRTVDIRLEPSIVHDGVKVRKEKGGARHHPPARAWPMPPEDAELEQASAMFRALGDPARLRLLARLASGEVCVTELAEFEDEKLTTVSARLKTLHDVTLVKRRREAKHIYYSLSDTHVLRLVEKSSMLPKGENRGFPSDSKRKEKRHDHLHREAPSQPYPQARSELRAYGGPARRACRLPA